MSDPTPDQQSEITYLSGVAADGTLAPISYWTWNYAQPASYTHNYQSKFGAPTAGTAGTIVYAFDAASRWTSTEKAAFQSAMALWSAIANVSFVDTSAQGYDPSSTVVISRVRDGTASGGAESYYPGRIGTRTLGQSLAGSIKIDTSVAGFGPLGSTLSDYGGYPWTTIIHEVGHVVGLGHGGPYNDGDTTSDPQFTRYDTLAYTVMSYNDATGVDWGSSLGDDGRTYADTPTTPMILDVAAAQRLYGLPASTPLGGGQVFGYNSNIGGAIGKFFDFTINTKPVVTLWDGGGNNTLDLSGSAADNLVYLAPGSVSSVLGLDQNLAIAFGTRIDRYIGGSSTNDVYGNDDGDIIYGGNAGDSLNGGAGNDYLFGGAGADTVNGLGGIDSSRYAGLYRHFAVDLHAAGGGATIDPVAGRAGDRDIAYQIEDYLFDDGRLVVDAGSTAAEVYRLYDTVLGRAPDPLGLDDATGLLDRGAPDNELARALIGSPEFQNATGSLSDSDFIEYLYQHALHRASDAPGKAAWTSYLAAGNSRADMAVGFSDGAEHRGLTAAAVNAGLFVDNQSYQEVAALYDSFADRLPDAPGLQHWVDFLGGGKTLGQVADQFAISNEFTTRTAGLDDAQLVDFLYHTTLDRAPDAPGEASWLGALDNGLSRGGLLLGFAESSEHLQLIAPNITEGIATLG